MITVTISEARRCLADLARKAEEGETIVVTRFGQPIFDIVPHQPRGGINREAFKRERGLDRLVTYIADDFDEPLPEDFLLRPLPDKP